MRQVHSLGEAGAISGGFWGALIGTIFLSPLLGMVIGASASGVAGSLTDVGIDNQFMKKLADRMRPGCSILFILARSVTPDKDLDESRGAGGMILQTSLRHEDEARLQGVLAGAPSA